MQQIRMYPFSLVAVCFFFLQCSVYTAVAQDTYTAPQIVEQELENLTENNEDVETEDDAYLQQMQSYLKDPVNLNTAGESDLNGLSLLSVLQKSSLLNYRKIFGKFIDIYELQAVPGWDIALIQRIRPYITVANKLPVIHSLKSRLSAGENTLLTRVSQVLERSRGYRADSAVANFYAGSPQKLLVRYKYKYKNMLQYGITAEKDAGEQFFKGRQKAGFDYYSAHFFARDAGIIKSLAIGDFTVNLGQGLIQWQGLAFKKSSSVLNIKRQSDKLRPYNSAGEILFHRGAAITLQKKGLEATAFLSYRNLDANFQDDTIHNQDYVSALQVSGYHRTNSEIADKNKQGQFTLGGNISVTRRNAYVGFNVVNYNFRHPIIKSGDLYNKFALTGDAWRNYSVDYSYTFKNLHFFGEAAFDKNYSRAAVNGLLINADSRIALSFLYRKISRGYQSLYTNAFTESTFPNNESGFYSGISITPSTAWRIDAYADVYNFPWLRFRVNAPSSGKDYLFQITYKPSKVLEIYSRYRAEQKAINYNPDASVLSSVYIKPKQNWRNQLNYKISSALNLRSRVEVLWYDKQGNLPENGFLIYTDLLYKPLLKPYAANMRLQYFESDSYNSRLYAYENDVLYSFSIPVFYDKGYRYYFNLQYDVLKGVTAYFRLAQSIFLNKITTGTALDQLNSNKKTEIKCQLLINL